MQLINRLLDNRFWYVGFTHAEFNKTDYENNPCVILRNPFGKWSPESANIHCEAYTRAYNELQKIINKEK